MPTNPAASLRPEQTLTDAVLMDEEDGTDYEYYRVDGCDHENPFVCNCRYVGAHNRPNGAYYR